MRRGTFAAMLIAALMAAGMPVEAQVKLRILPPVPPVLRIKPPRINRPLPAPNVAIPPSRALQIAGQMVPNGKPIGVKLSGDNKYVVILRTNNTVTRVIVDAQTGAAN